MTREIRLTPSILNADFTRLDEEIQKISGASDLLHLDVMDNIFVPNFTFDFEAASQIISNSPLPVDAHLMVANVESSQPYILVAFAFTIAVSIIDKIGFEQVVQLNVPLLVDHLTDTDLSGAVLSLMTSVVFTKTVVSLGERINLNLKSFLLDLLLPSFNSDTIFSSSNTSVIEIGRAHV